MSELLEKWRQKGMYKRQFLIYGLAVLLGSMLLSGCNIGGTTSSAVEDEEPTVEANVKQLLKTNECEGCDLSDANLIGADLRLAKLKDADLSGANLNRADLRRADLYAADLSNANLQSANMQNADLKHAIMRDADLRDADLTDATMSAGSKGHFDVDLTGATWTDGSTCGTKSCDGKAY